VSRPPRSAGKVPEPVAPVFVPPAPRREEMRDLEAYERARARRALATKAWLIFGLVAATLIVIAAFVFRPDHYLPAPAASTTSVAGVPEMPPLDENDASVIPEPTIEETAVPIRVTPQDHAGPVETAEAFEPAPVATAAADGPLAGVTSVRLRVGPGFPGERQQAIIAALTEAGVAQVRVEELPFEIATSRVGYYRTEDLTGAEALARLVSPIVDQGAELGVRDYGELLSNPEPRRLDLWVGH
jgi:hypothetical protein